jgi:hypothetical protein
MKVQNFPDIDLPTVTVSASLPGAAPAQLETEVARKIENAHRTLQGLKHIYTKVQDGAVTVTAEFRLEKPTQEAVDDVRSPCSGAQRPARRPARPHRQQDGPGRRSPSWPSPWRSRAHGRRGPELVCRQHRHARLLAVRGVGAVNRVGGVTREVQVALDPLKLQALGATAADISRQLRQVQQKAPVAAPTWAAASSRCAPGHRGHGRGAGRLELSLSRRPPRAAGPGGHRERHRGRAAQRGHCSTASRWWASRWRAARAPARWKWARPCKGAGRAQGRPPRPGADRGLRLRDPVQESTTAR